jgi:hypothetical protein
VYEQKGDMVDIHVRAGAARSLGLGNFSHKKCKNCFLYMTFLSIAQSKHFHSLKSALVIETHAIEGYNLEQHQQGNPEKSIIH